MAGERWTHEEIEHLETLIGDIPFYMMRDAYNKWARNNSYPIRTHGGLEYQIAKMKISRHAVGSWVRSSDVCKMLGISKSTPKRWGDAGLIRIRKARHNSHGAYYIRRRDLISLARSCPYKFAGIAKDKLLLLFEDEALAESIASAYTSRPGVKRRVKCVETGRVYASVASAASSVFISRRCIQRAIAIGVRAAGYHWVCV